MATEVTQACREALMKAEVNFSSHVFKIILMGDGFQFNPVSHKKYSDVSAFELPTASGYTIGGATLTGVVITMDDPNKQINTSWANPSWIATGGNLSAIGALIYNDTHVNDILIGFIDHGSLQTVLSGGTYTIANVVVRYS